MQLKQYLRYKMDFNSKWVRNSAFFIGLSFFARILYLFVLNDITQLSVGGWIVQLSLPLLLCLAYIVLIRVVKWNAPGVFAILGTLFCLLVIIWNCYSGNALRIILSILFYSVASVALLATAAGFLPGKQIPAVILITLLVFRIVFYSTSLSGLNLWILEISVLSVIASLYFLPLGFVPIIPKTRDDQKDETEEEKDEVKIEEPNVDLSENAEQ